MNHLECVLLYKCDICSTTELKADIGVLVRSCHCYLHLHGFSTVVLKNLKCNFKDVGLRHTSGYNCDKTFLCSRWN